MRRCVAKAWRRLLYRLYLRLPWWRRTRRLALARAGNRCQLCGAHRELQVHHRQYSRGGRSVLWRERPADLQVLCRRCHQSAHRRVA
jgi:5-methylcytosine-specific restriction endonuclease McrA